MRKVLGYRLFRRMDHSPVREIKLHVAIRIMRPTAASAVGARHSCGIGGGSGAGEISLAPPVCNLKGRFGYTGNRPNGAFMPTHLPACTEDSCEPATGCVNTNVGPPTGSQQVDFTGSVESLTVPGCVTTITIEVWGAQGEGGTGGLGGSTWTATLANSVMTGGLRTGNGSVLISW